MPTDDTPEHLVSLSPTDAALDPVRQFKVVEDDKKTDRATYTVPAASVYRGLETVAALVTSATWHASIAHVGNWALWSGLPRLRALADVQSICAARADLLRRGCDVTIANEWPFALPTYGHPGERVDLRRLDKVTMGQCRDASAGLGLKSSTVAALAMLTALNDIPLRGETPWLIQGALRSFKVALRQRAIDIAELCARAVPAAPAGQRPSLEEL